MTLEYIKERKAFGRPIGSFQNSRFKMAELKTELEITRAFLDRTIERYVAGTATVEEAAMAKWWTTELLGKVTDTGVQLHGGYGYTTEYPISKAWVDARNLEIAGTGAPPEAVGSLLPEKASRWHSLHCSFARSRP